MSSDMKTRLIGVAASVTLFTGYLCIAAGFGSDWERGFKVMGAVVLLGVGAWLFYRYLDRKLDIS